MPGVPGRPPLPDWVEQHQELLFVAAVCLVALLTVCGL